MHLIVYPGYDATIYENAPYKNTGADPYINVGKSRIAAIIDSGSVTAQYYNYCSRGVIKFNLSDIISRQLSGQIPTNVQRTFVLTLYNRHKEMLPGNVTFEVGALSLSGSNGNPPSLDWDAGIGLYDTPVSSSSGITWKTKGKPSLGPDNFWHTGSYNAPVTGSWCTIPGGGTWISNSIVTSSYEYITDHLSIDVTSIVESWLSGSYPNHGFLIKRTSADEFSSESLGLFSFYSRDTNTVYTPTLRVSWDGSVYNTSSLELYELSGLRTEQNCVVWIQDLKSTYSPHTVARFYPRIRDKFPIKTYTTRSYYDQSLTFPIDTQYALYDAYSGREIMPFGSASKISVSASRAYFDIDIASLQEQCYYDIYLKVQWPSTNILEGPFRFKVSDI